ncbi:indole-3-glycerol phosphate synthase TrpC [Anaerolineales bacterium]
MSTDFVKTDTILDRIMQRKVEEVKERSTRVKAAELALHLQEREAALDFLAALKKDTVALIAEVKKASPSKGVLIEDFDPQRIAASYGKNGASAVSVLTDTDFFQGDLNYLPLCKAASGCPVLRKDFIISSYQVLEARAYDADAVLLIVACLSDSQLKDLYDQIIDLGMTALVEVHDEAEMERALHLGTQLIGVNNRDLKSFHVNLETTTRLAKMITNEICLVAESGIESAADVRRMADAGASAVLVGESLVKSGNIADKVKELSTVARRVSAE